LLRNSLLLLVPLLQLLLQDIPLLTDSVIKRIKVNEYHKAGILGVEAFIGLWWTETFNALFWLLGLASIVLVAHAVLRPAQGRFGAMADEVKNDVKNLEHSIKKSK